MKVPEQFAVPTDDLDRMSVVLGSRLRWLRLRAGLSYADLERRTGINRPNLIRIESGRNNYGSVGAFPRVDTVIRLARALEVKPSEIINALDGL